MINKAALLHGIINALEKLHQGALKAALQAYTTATHKENIAENKYDTLGLEAAYLAQGQHKRVTECQKDLAAFKGLTAKTFSPDSPISLGALVLLGDEDNASQYVFLGSGAGGLKLTYEEKEITLITPSAPLGKALLGLYSGDEAKINVGGSHKHFEVLEIY